MKRLFLFIFCFITISTSAQEEKRLALVIGNANYEKGALKNPVNDAALMKQTLEKLNFDVIYATNLEHDRDMKDRIIEFGKKRGEYNVGFIYYAGHGIQVGGENYLLPTKEKFNCEDDVLNYGVNVQTIMKYLISNSNSVNVLVLDACRNNPLEQINCPNNSRSLNDRGLAKLPAPTGSLIAFSTSANTTASDGDGENTLYCKSLAKNLQQENTSIDQVFRNVREDVIRKSNGKQIPEEVSKLVGKAFYLLKNKNMEISEKILSGNFTKDQLLNLIDERKEITSQEIYKIANENFENEKYEEAIENLKSLNENKDIIIQDINSVLDTIPYHKIKYLLGRSYQELNKIDDALFYYSSAINDIEKGFKIDSFFRRTINNEEEKYYESRIEAYIEKKYYQAALSEVNLVSKRVKRDAYSSKIYNEISDFKEAKKIAKQSLKNINENNIRNREDSINISNLYLNLAVAKDNLYFKRIFPLVRVGSVPIWRGVKYFFVSLTTAIITPKSYFSGYNGPGKKLLSKAYLYDNKNVGVFENQIDWIYKNKNNQSLVSHFFTYNENETDDVFLNNLCDSILEIDKTNLFAFNFKNNLLLKQIIDEFKIMEYEPNKLSSAIEKYSLIDSICQIHVSNASLIESRALASFYIFNFFQNFDIINYRYDVFFSNTSSKLYIKSNKYDFGFVELDSNFLLVKQDLYLDSMKKIFNEDIKSTLSLEFDFNDLLMFNNIWDENQVQKFKYNENSYIFKKGDKLLLSSDVNQTYPKKLFLHREVVSDDKNIEVENLIFLGKNNNNYKKFYENSFFNINYNYFEFSHKDDFKFLCYKGMELYCMLMGYNNDYIMSKSLQKSIFDKQILNYIYIDFSTDFLSNKFNIKFFE